MGLPSSHCGRQKVANGKKGVRRGKRRNSIGIGEADDTAVTTGRGLTVDIERAPVDIQHPVFRNSRSGIDRRFDASVELQGRIRHFDEEKNVLGTGSVVTILRDVLAQDGNIWLRLIVVVGSDW